MEFDLHTKDKFAALRIADYRRFIAARFFFTIATQMQYVIVGWQIYQLTHDALSLGLTGIFEAVPFIGLALFAGHVADRVDRKLIIILSVSVYVICAIILLLISTQFHSLLTMYGSFPIYIIIFVTGLARGFLSPAQSAFSAQIVPRELFGNASTWNSTIWQTGAISGPAIGGLIYGFLGVGWAYIFVFFFALMSFLFFISIKKKPMPPQTEEENIWQSLSTGLKFVFGNQIILSAISLDMFAVFFGGAVSVLPIFADDILHTGAQGLGLLRAAPAIGAIIMSGVLFYYPPFKTAGRNLLIAVFGFGISIILFALSKNFYLTFILLVISGMFDNVSVIIRSTVMQVYTPDSMRGRVSSVNGIFIGSSNELGSFESGFAAKIMGLVPSVIFGGSMTLGVVAAVRKLSPKLRGLKL